MWHRRGVVTLVPITPIQNWKPEVKEYEHLDYRACASALCAANSSTA